MYMHCWQVGAGMGSAPGSPTAATAAMRDVEAEVERMHSPEIGQLPHSYCVHAPIHRGYIAKARALLSAIVRKMQQVCSTCIIQHACAL
jgi:hypothetical protein